MDKLTQIVNEIEAIEQNAKYRQRKLTHHREWLADVIGAELRRRSRVGGLIVKGSGVAIRYRYPAQTSQALVAWCFGKTFVRVERIPARTNREPQARQLTFVEALELFDGEAAKRLRERRAQRRQREPRHERS